MHAHPLFDVAFTTWTILSIWSGVSRRVHQVWINELGMRDMKRMAWSFYEFNVEAYYYFPFHNKLKPTCTYSLINCLDLFWQMLSFNPIVLPIIYQRCTLILTKIRWFHNRCSSVSMKYSTSKDMIVCFSSNGFLRSIEYNRNACINGQISPQICPSIAWFKILICVCVSGLWLQMGYCNAWDTNL